MQSHHVSPGKTYTDKIRYSSTGWWFEPLWKIWKSVGMIIPNIWENKKCSKPPTRLPWVFLRAPLPCVGRSGDRALECHNQTIDLGLKDAGTNRTSTRTWKGELHVAQNWENDGKMDHVDFKYPLVIKHSYWKWPFIVDFPAKNCDFPQLC